MRILMVSEDVPHMSMGGLGKHAITLAKALMRCGCAVDFLGNDSIAYERVSGELGFAGRFFGALKGVERGWKEGALGCFNPLRRPVVARRMAGAISNLARSYDVVHYHGHFPNLGKYISGAVNFVQTRHDQGSDCLIHTRFKEGAVCSDLAPASCARCASSTPNWLQSGVSSFSVSSYRRSVAASFRKHKTIFVSEAMRRNFARCAGSGQWGAVIHNFVDYQSIRTLSRNAPASQDGLCNVFIAGKVAPPKGIELFLQHYCPDPRADMRVRIAGDGPDEKRLREQFASPLVELLGWCSYGDVVKHTAAADAIVVPSVWEEPCATTVLEALALGKPTFALRRGGTPELVAYQRYANQLKLFDTMEQLVAGLRELEGEVYRGTLDDFSGDVSYATQRILEVYESPKERYLAGDEYAPVARALSM